ncbi:hypothetical protein RYX36_027967, partial [Vicia faba]
LLAGWQKEYWHVSGFVIRNLTEISHRSPSSSFSESRRSYFGITSFVAPLHEE